MKVLQLYYKMPFPMHDGGAYSIYHSSLALLSQGADVKILAINTPKSWVKAETIPAEFREKTKFEFVKVDTRIKAIPAIINLLSSRSYFSERYYSAKYALRLSQLLQEEQYDVIQLEHLYMGVYLNTIRKYSSARVVLRAQNVEHLLWNSIIANEIDPYKTWYLKIANNRLTQFEREIAGKVDGIMAISDQDSKVFREIAPGKPNTSIPAGVDFTKLENSEPEKQYVNYPTFYHLGSMDWIPNQQGIRWFLEDVFPVIKYRFPEFTLHLAGKKMPEWVKEMKLDGVIVDGEVADAKQYQSDKAILIVPLLSGGGIRIKIIEAMAMGKTVISTRVGAEGIPCQDDLNILIADTAEEFLKKVQKCIESEEIGRGIGRYARKLALSFYDDKNLGEKMLAFYTGILNQS